MENNATLLTNFSFVLENSVIFHEKVLSMLIRNEFVIVIFK